jgi:transposase
LLDILGHRLSRAGNRQLNSALRLVAHVQRIHPGDWRNYHLPKIDEGKNPKEAMRCLIGRVSRVQAVGLFVGNGEGRPRCLAT